MNTSSEYFPSHCKPTKMLIEIPKEDEKGNFHNIPKTVYLVSIAGEEYDNAVFASTNMKANTKTGEWGSGMANTEDDPRKVERTGRLGEMALAKVMGASIDLSYRDEGDMTDITYMNVTIDVKTAIRLPHFYAGLVKATNTARTRRVKFKSQVYYFAYVHSEDRQKKEAVVALVGYALRKNFPKTREEMCVARMGSHLNYEFPYETLKQFRMFEQ